MSQNRYMTSLGRIPTGPSTAINASDGDTIMLRYEWPGNLGGRDADTYTGIEPGNGTAIDGVKNASGGPTRYLGYAGSGNNIIGAAQYLGSSSDLNNSGCLMYWAGDNTQSSGQEVVLIRPKSIAGVYTSINTFRIGIYLNWFSVIGNGCMNFVMRVYSGSSFSASGTYDLTASGGTLRRTYTFNANTNNINNPNNPKIGFPSNGINGYAQIGIFTFSADGNGIFRYNLNAVGSCTA